MNNNLFYVLILMFIISCDQSKKVDSLRGVDSQKKKVPEQVFKLINECINCGCHWSFYNNKGKHNNIRISKVYYSLDSTKALILVTHQLNGKKNEKYENVDFHVGFDPFIAYKVDSFWVIYHYGWKMANHYASYKYVEEEIIKYFEGPNYRDKVFVYQYTDKKIEGPIGVSPNNPDFWKSDLWKKNIEIEGLYPFEIRRTNVGTEKVKSINQLLEEKCGDKVQK